MNCLTTLGLVLFYFYNVNLTIEILWPSTERFSLRRLKCNNANFSFARVQSIFTMLLPSKLSSAFQLVTL